MAWFNSYPQSLIESKKSEVVFCQLLFTNTGLLDTFYLHNTDNEEIKKLFSEFIKGIDFKNFLNKGISVVIPYVFKDENTIDVGLKITDKLFSNLFNKKRGKDATCFLEPVYVIYYYPKPPKKVTLTETSKRDEIVWIVEEVCGDELEICGAWEGENGFAAQESYWILSLRILV